MACLAQAHKLSIVIDDVGYRLQNENKLLQMPVAISIAILPNAPHAREMAIKAHKQGREILIHLPMAPLSKQPLEPDTLHPSMSSEEIQRIISQAVANVPYAVGVNNHMGSAMTSNLPAMQKVMRALEPYQLYFLDSLTTSDSQVSRAAGGTDINVLKRKIFLDNLLNESAIRQQFNRAVQIARRDGSAIAIGHPHPATIHVLQQMLSELPADVMLVPPSMLLNESLPHNINSRAQAKMTVPRAEMKNEQVKAIEQCKITLRQYAKKIDTERFFIFLAESLIQKPIVMLLKYHWQQWVGDEIPTKLNTCQPVNAESSVLPEHCQIQVVND